MSRHSCPDTSVDFSETDLIKLQQQYRKAKKAKRAYTKKTQDHICRDEQEIKRLQEERERLLSNVRVSESSFNQWTDASVGRDLTAMLTRSERIDEELEAEKAKLTSLKAEILKWERKLERQRIDGGTARLAKKSDNSDLLKSTCLLEDKLYKGRKSFSKLVTRNGELREELKTLQMQKEQFLHDKSLKKKELHALRKDISDQMTKCTEAFNARAKIQEKQKMLRDQDAKDVAQYNHEKSNLEQEISHYCNFEAISNMKATARTNQDIIRQVEKYKKKREKEFKEFGLKDFEEAIKEILKETEESDLDKLIRNFLQMEEQNYTLLKFVNYQHEEAEAIRKQISQLHSEREQFVAEKQQQQEQNQAHWIKLSIKQEATGQQLAVYQQRVEFTEQLLDQLKEGVESLLQISHGSSVKCDQLDSSDGVQDENIKEYLRKVEDRVNEMLSLQSYLRVQKKLSQWDIDSLSTIAGQLLGLTPPPVSLTTAAMTPAPHYDPDLVESELQEAEEPMSREELLTLLNKRLSITSEEKEERLT